MNATYSKWLKFSTTEGITSLPRPCSSWSWRTSLSLSTYYSCIFLIIFVYLKQDEDVFNERVRILSDQEGNAVEAEAVVLKDLTKVCHTINWMYGKTSPRILLYALICIKRLDAYACYLQPKSRSVEHPISLHYLQPGHTARPPHPAQTLACPTKTAGSVDVWRKATE